MQHQGPLAQWAAALDAAPAPEMIDITPYIEGKEPPACLPH
jgi:hypothetical protein